jgi:TDG/mug DNA glycosylase family protein
VPDVIAPKLDVLFCGINPGLYTAVVGLHFARPGNRFWPALHASGFTPHLLAPEEEWRMIDYGLGITNVVDRASASAAALRAEEYRQGAQHLERKVRQFAPRWLAVLGIGAYRTAFKQPEARIGPQPHTIGKTRVWVLPNPSGLNAHYRPAQLAELFAELRHTVERERSIG